jgi:hypothetical protein
VVGGRGHKKAMYLGPVGLQSYTFVGPATNQQTCVGALIQPGGDRSDLAERPQPPCESDTQALTHFVHDCCVRNVGLDPPGHGAGGLAGAVDDLQG